MKAGILCSVYRSALGFFRLIRDHPLPSAPSTNETYSFDKPKIARLEKQCLGSPSLTDSEIPLALIKQKTRLLTSGVVKPLFCRADLQGKCSFCSANVRDHRHLPVARSMPGAKRPSMERDAGRCSVDRIVSLYFFDRSALLP